MKITYTKPEIKVRKCFLNDSMMLQASMGDGEIIDQGTSPVVEGDPVSGDGITEEHYDAWGDARGNRGGFGHSWD